MEKWRTKIAREYGQIVKSHRGITVKIDQSKVKAKVKTVVPIDEATQVKLHGVLKQLAGKDVELVNVIDPSILGGMLIQLGDLVIDMSLSGRLSDLENRIHAEITRQFDKITPEASQYQQVG